MVGVYGVMSWVVSQRTGEFGIRMALGARARDVVTMLLGQSLRPILGGLVLGALGGIALSRALNSVFWRMTSADQSKSRREAITNLIWSVGLRRSRLGQ